MADAPDPPNATPAKPARPPADPVQSQRAMVYSMVALMCLTGLVVGMALSDPCQRYGGEATLVMSGRRCSEVVQWRDYLPGTAGWTAFAVILVANILIYELRWIVRVAGPAVLGGLYLLTAIVAFTKDQPMVLPVFYGLFGGGLLLSAYGIARGRREGWAFALSMTGVMLLAHFFGASKIATETGWPMAYALLPSMAIMLPILIALVTTPPGAKVYAPFATKPSV